MQSVMLKLRWMDHVLEQIGACGQVNYKTARAITNTVYRHNHDEHQFMSAIIENTSYLTNACRNMLY